MKKMFLSALAVAALAFVGCTNDATTDLAQDGGAAVELHTFTFEAEIEQPSRTSLVDPGEGTSYVCWDENDVVGIICEDDKVYKATIASGAGTPYATYSAEISGTPVAAIYPYQFANDTKSTVSADLANSKISLTFPALQTYKAGSVFGDDENVMVGIFSEGANGPKCALKSVMGVMELKFKGSQKVQGVTVKASKASQKISGIGNINISEHTLAMGTANTSFSFATLDVEDVTLNSSTATSFYVLVPAGTYEGLQIGVMTEDGSYARTATQAHTVEVGKITPINCGNLDTMIDEASAVNLSDGVYANCYAIVPDGAEKTYVFDTKLVDGTNAHEMINTYLNGRYITTTFKNHCTEDEIKAHTAQILWAENAGTAYDIQLDKANGKIYFKNDGESLGNTRIMLTCDPVATHTRPSDIMQPDNHFIWGWHIWATNSTPAVSIARDSSNKSINMMDRNLGATWSSTKVADIAEMTATEAAGAVGLYYQFGNMAPQPRQETFVPASGSWGHAKNMLQYGYTQYTQSWTNSGAAKSTIAEHIQFPYYRYAVSYCPKVYHSSFAETDFTSKYNWIKMDIICGTNSSNDGDKSLILWGGQGPKANHDPCPPGWVAPHRGNIYQAMAGTYAGDAYRHLAPQVSGKYVGHYITYDDTNCAFYPWSGYHGSNAIGNVGKGYFWACGYYTQGDNASTNINEERQGTSQTHNMATYAIATNDGTSINPNYNFEQKDLATGYQVRCVKK